MNKALLFTILIFSILITQSKAQQYRYTNNIFPIAPTMQANVIYDQAPFLNAPYSNETQTTNQNLVMDIFQPTGDTSTRRAVLICVHGGGFISGNRSHQDMLEFCDSFARKGYVTATISYRIGANVTSFTNTPMHYIRAVYRGVQDGRSAVRYFRANAAPLGIDPAHIYLLGSSAGAFVALNAMYFDLPSEKPIECGTYNYTMGIWPFLTPVTAPDLGAIDRGSNLGFDGTPNGSISLWGAVEDTAILQNSGTTFNPVLLIHGTSDVIVPYETGKPFNVPFFPEVQGSAPINTCLNNLNSTKKETYIVNGVGHEFYGVTNGNWTPATNRNAYWDTIVGLSVDFLWRVAHKPKANFSSTSNSLNASFTDLSTDALDWQWDFGDGNTSTAQDPSHTYATPGTYTVTLYIEDEIDSWDTLSQTITIQNTLPIQMTVWEVERIDALHVSLAWATSSELNNRGYIVERKINLSNEWQEVGFVDGAGNSQSLQSYSLIDNNNASETSYYRLKIVATDGSFEYTSMKAVKGIKKEWDVVVFPTPVADVLTFSLKEANTNQVDIKIINSSGQLLVKKSSLITPYQSIQVKETQNLPSGTYWLILDFKARGQKRIPFIKS